MCFVFGFENTNGITTATACVDIIVFIGQYVLYLIKFSGMEAKKIKKEEAGESTALIDS